MVRIRTRASLLQMLRHLMNDDSSHVVGRAWVVTFSYGSYEILAKHDLLDSSLPILESSNTHPLPPVPIDSLALLKCAALTFGHEDVEFCRIGHNGFDLIIFLDDGDSIIDVDDAIVERLLADQAIKFRDFKSWWID